ncbi:nuclear RNA export factor 1-like [Rhipicephalus sanguineus]|uniref:nuclear RNA export factor 1-like n=1 Tax=Rhipicephalus sanguineus TaxID=34632 RepID=UPI0020C4E828|nr:nuclear RNA export factor 1-like [Rhipicephalus sanguineus]
MSSRGPRSQSFYGHDDRAGDRGGNRGRGGGGPRGGGRMGNRGGFGAPILKRYNRQKFGGGPSGGQPGYGRRGGGGNRARFADEDGDIEMQGGNLPDHMRNRFKPYNNSYNRNRKRRGMPDRRGGRDVYVPPHLQNKNSEGTWYKVVIPQGKKFGKDFIYREIKARISVPLIPYNFQFDGHNAVFYIADVATAAAVRNLNRAIDTPSGFKMAITVKGSDLPIVAVDDDVIQSLKLVMSKRYDAARGHLDLSNFQKDESLKELNLYITFTRPSIMSIAVKIIVENVPEVQTLDLSNNKLTTLYPLGPVQGACKQLRSLNFANNRILKMAELDSMKGHVVRPRARPGGEPGLHSVQRQEPIHQRGAAALPQGHPAGPQRASPSHLVRPGPGRNDSSIKAKLFPLGRCEADRGAVPGTVLHHI